MIFIKPHAKLSGKILDTRIKNVGLQVLNNGHKIAPVVMSPISQLLEFQDIALVACSSHVVSMTRCQAAGKRKSSHISINIDADI
jgi:hypothetical protein